MKENSLIDFEENDLGNQNQNYVEKKENQFVFSMENLKLIPEEEKNKSPPSTTEEDEPLNDLINDDAPLIKEEEEDNNTKRNNCPVENASIFSKLTYHWISGLLKIGYKRPLKHSDL